MIPSDGPLNVIHVSQNNKKGMKLETESFMVFNDYVLNLMTMFSIFVSFDGGSEGKIYMSIRVPSLACTFGLWCLNSLCSSH